MKISFVIPCYGSELTIRSVVDEIIIKIKERKFDYEIILVNDHSYDKVWNIIKSLAEENKHIKAINLSKNMNKPGALMAGFSIVTGDIVVTLDDDLQCPVTNLYDLIDPVINGHDVSVAKYPVKKQSKFKNFGSSVNKKMAEIMINKPKDLYFTNFQAMKRYIIDEIVKYTNPFPYVEGLILRITTDIVNVTMEERERTLGKTNFTFKKMMKMWLNGFTSFSIKPLRLSIYMGFICSILGFSYAIYTIINKIFDPNIMMGYSSLMAALLFIGGMIMVILGLIGEYVGRIYISINNAPQYVIKEKINVKE